MKVLSAYKIREWDIATMDSELITSLELMERAATYCADQIMLDFDDNFVFHIIVNKGNNGGDGLVIARKLLENKYKLRITVLDFIEKSSDEFLHNLSLLPKDSISFVSAPKDMIFDMQEVIVDAIFGYGLNRNTSGYFSKVIDAINKLGSTVLSIDIPSGLFADDNSDNSGSIIISDITYTFQCIKFAFLLESYAKYVGDMKVIDIGLDRESLDSIETNYYVLTKNILPSFLEHDRFSHKGLKGHALLIGGQEAMRGAIILSSKAALRSGIGKISVSLPNKYIQELNLNLPEAMYCNDLTQFSNYSAIGVGPGMGTDRLAKKILHNLLLKREKKPIILDADAINIISKDRKLLQSLQGAILTPHVGEFKKLCGDYKSDEEKIEKQINFAVRFQVTLILKGAFTTIALPSGNLFFNIIGNPGMATAGTGDVLTGIILGLLTQGYSSMDSALLGVFLHGYSADLALESQSQESLVASDIIDYLGDTFKQLY